MLLTKQQLRAHVMTSDDETRYALSHVKVEPDGRVSATNGHLAVLVTPKGQARIEEAEFPPIPGLDGDNPTAPLYLTAETAQAAEAIAPGRDPSQVGNRVRLLVNGRVLLGASDGQTPQIVTVEPPAVDTFPDIASMLMIQPPGSTVWLAPAALERIAKYARAFGVRTIRMTVRGPVDMMSFRWSDDYHDVDLGLMPMRDPGAVADPVHPPRERPEKAPEPVDERTPDMFAQGTEAEATPAPALERLIGALEEHLEKFTPEERARMRAETEQAPEPAGTVAPPAPKPAKKARGKVVKKKAKKPAGRRR